MVLFYYKLTPNLSLKSWCFLVKFENSGSIDTKFFSSEDRKYKTYCKLKVSYSHYLYVADIFNRYLH